MFYISSSLHRHKTIHIMEFTFDGKEWIRADTDSDMNWYMVTSPKGNIVCYDIGNVRGDMYYNEVIPVNYSEDVWMETIMIEYFDFIDREWKKFPHAPKDDCVNLLDAVQKKLECHLLQHDQSSISITVIDRIKKLEDQVASLMGSDS